MTILDQAILTATQAHSGALRKGGHIPYILHPLEAAAICAALTDDLEVLAAAVLHDILEDTDYSAQQLEEAFGPRVTGLVLAETEEKRPHLPPEATWHIRKEEAVSRLRQETRREVLILTLGDKLSNLRSMVQAYAAEGTALWTRFHQSDPKAHCWYYREMGRALLPLSPCPALEEYWALCRTLWPEESFPPL